jgi:dienelactone hydrolase
MRNVNVAAIIIGTVLASCVPPVGVMSASAATAVPWYSPATTPVIKEPVTFTNEGATLHGTIYIPNLGRKVPAIVVFHGASEPLAGTPLYEHLRDGLPQIGVAVLLFDRRGTGASTGNPRVPYAALTDDGIAGARAVRGLPNIDPNRVGYWGISQGGWLATFAASRDSHAAFAIAVSAPLVTAETQMEFAMSNQLSVLGYGKVDIDSMLEARRRLDGYFNGHNPRADAVAALRSIQDKPWFKLMYLPRADAVSTNAKDSVWRKQMDLDSFAAVLRVNVPMLFILGDSDPWIPVSRTVDLLRAASKKDPCVHYAVVPSANHLMMTPPKHERMSDAGPAAVAVEKPDAVAYFMSLTAWLQQNVISARR